MAPKKTALFVRVPTPLADRLDERARRSGRTKQDLVSELLALAAPERDDRSAGDEPDVLDVDEAARLLRIAPEDVMRRVAHGDLPARRFGEQWRFSRTAILAWLAGNDPLSPTTTGFGPTSR